MATMRGVTNASDRWGRPILTVGQLKEVLAGLSDDEHVLIATGDWYVNVEAVGVPMRNTTGDNASDWEFVTLFPGPKFDTWQR